MYTVSMTCFSYGSYAYQAPSLAYSAKRFCGIQKLKVYLKLEDYSRTDKLQNLFLKLVMIKANSTYF
jgi:hypothetical protein